MSSIKLHLSGLLNPFPSDGINPVNLTGVLFQSIFRYLQIIDFCVSMVSYKLVSTLENIKHGFARQFSWLVAKQSLIGAPVIIFERLSYLMVNRVQVNIDDNHFQIFFGINEFPLEWSLEQTARAVLLSVDGFSVAVEEVGKSLSD